MTKRYVTVLLAAGALLVAACSSDASPVDAPSGASEDSAQQAASEGASPAEDSGDGAALDAPTEFAEEIADGLEEVQAAEGGGSATFTVGEQVWTFESVLCANGPDEIGQEGAEFVLSSIQDGLQMYVSIDSFGHSISLDDVEDFENPSVSLYSTGDDFVSVDGKTINADAEFVDGNTDDFATTAGTFTATCP